MLPQNVLPFVSSVDELAESVRAYQREMLHLTVDPDFYPEHVIDDARQAIARARQWVAVPNELGSYDVGFAKLCGYRGNTIEHYSKFRKTRDHTRLDGTEAERRIRDLGGTVYPVGHGMGKSAHDAVRAVRSFAKSMGKEPSALAVVRVFDRPVALAEREPEKPVVFGVLLAAINAAGLSDDLLDELFSRVRA